MEFFWSVFSCIQSKYKKIRTRKNSVFGYFPRSVATREVYQMRKSSADFFYSFSTCRVQLILRKAMSMCFLVNISNGSWRDYLVLLDILAVCLSIKHLLQMKDFYPKCFKFYRLGSHYPSLLNGKMLLKNSKMFYWCFLIT